MDGSLHGAVRYLGVLFILMITRIHAGRKFMKDVFKTGKELCQVLVTSIAEFLKDDMPICMSLLRFPLIPKRRSQGNILSRHEARFVGTRMRGYLRMTALL